jgi:hypothetical protein
MAIVNGSLQEGYKDAAWFAANPTLVLLVGQKVNLEQSGTYKLGDGVTDLSALSFLGGTSTTPNLQQVTDEGSTTTNPITTTDSFKVDIAGLDAALVSGYELSVLDSTLGVKLFEADRINDTVKVLGVEVATVNDLSTKQDKNIIVSASQTAVLDERYIMNATSTFTDPTPVEGKGYHVTVLNGTATVGGTAYSILGTQILRMYNSGAWVTYINYSDTEFVDISGTSTIVGWASFTTKQLQERVKGEILNITCIISGTSNSTSTTFTLSANATSKVTAQYSAVKFTNNGAASATFGLAEIVGGTNIITIYRTNTGASWSNSGTKTIRFSAEIQL